MYYYKAIDKREKSYFVKTIFEIKNNREMTEFLQENKRIDLSNEIVLFVKYSFAGYFFGVLKERGGRGVTRLRPC